MNSENPIVGIDVSHRFFDAQWLGNHARYENGDAGFRKLLSEVPANAEFVFEATGNYHYRLAYFLDSKGKSVKVLNPLSFKLWGRSLGGKAKTDKIDSKNLAKYAKTEKIRAQKEWKKLPPKLAKAKVILSQLYRLAKMERQAGNSKHAAALVLDKGDELLDVMGGIRKHCLEQKKCLEKQLYEIVGELYPDAFRLLKSIPSIGAKTAAALLVVCRGIEGYESHRKLSSFVGFAIRVHESGDSVKGKGRIIKVGNPYLRGLLYMCAMGAARSRKNRQCREFYEKLLAKGKPKKVAQAAVMHKLVKIAFAIVKNGTPFKEKEAA